MREKEFEAVNVAQDKELEEESVKLDQEIDQEIRGMIWSMLGEYLGWFYPTTELTEDERASILQAPELLDFVEQSSKIVQRALNDNYDYIRDYTIGTESGA